MPPQNVEHGIKTVDFSSFIDNSDKQRVSNAILASLRSIGFVYITNHGLPEETVKNMFEWSKQFFSLPMEVKQLAPHPDSGTHHRGYSSPGREKVSQHLYDQSELAQNRAKAPDVKESFESGREHDEAMPNIWLPEGILPGFKEACLGFFWECFELEKNIIKALALGFHLPEDYFLKFHTAPDNQLRLLHYPSTRTRSNTKNRQPFRFWFIDDSLSRRCRRSGSRGPKRPRDIRGRSPDSWFYRRQRG